MRIEELPNSLYTASLSWPIKLSQLIVTTELVLSLPGHGSYALWTEQPGLIYHVGILRT